jgi:hypothetical protein
VPCQHATTCPLFPRLHHSLTGWKTAFCDSEEASHGCARFQLSLTGKPVPLGLLPNGKVVSMGEEIKKTADVVTAEVEVAVKKLGFFARIRKAFAVKV